MCPAVAMQPEIYLKHSTLELKAYVFLNIWMNHCKTQQAPVEKSILKRKKQNKTKNSGMSGQLKNKKKQTCKPLWYWQHNSQQWNVSSASFQVQWTEEQANNT